MDNELTLENLTASQQRRTRALLNSLGTPCHTIPTLSVHAKTKHRWRVSDGIKRECMTRKATAEELEYIERRSMSSMQ